MDLVTGTPEEMAQASNPEKIELQVQNMDPTITAKELNSDEKRLDYQDIHGAVLHHAVESGKMQDDREGQDASLFTVTIRAFMALFMFGAFYSIFEDWPLTDGIWFAWVTMTTVGYGDYNPTTVEGKIFYLVTIWFGLGTIAIFIAQSLSNLAARRKEAADALKLMCNTDADGDTILRQAETQSKHKLMRSTASTIATLMIGALAICFSEGWSYFDSIYFAFETSSTIGYGDHGRLYRYNGTGDYWSDVTIGHNFSNGDVGHAECLASKGSCAVHESICVCIFSEKAKWILILYSFISFGVLGRLMDDIVAQRNFATENKKVGTTILMRIVFVSTYFLLGVLVFMFIEPSLEGSFFTSFYFNLVTLTTIGYGDYHPTVWGSRLFFILYSVTGLAIAAQDIATVSDWVRPYIVSPSKRLFSRCFGKALRDDEYYLIFFLVFSSASAVFWALFFDLIEQNGDWTALEFMLFQFIGFSTVGYGDQYYPANDAQRIFFVIVAPFYILLGAGALSTLQAITEEDTARTQEALKFAKHVQTGFEKLQDVNARFEAQKSNSNKLA